MLALPEHVHRVTAKGKIYFYFHPGRGTKDVGVRVRLPEDPHSPKFWEAYERLTGQRRNIPATQAGTFNALIADYRSSPEYGEKASSTKALNEHHLGIIAEIWGPRLVRGVRPKHVLELRDAFAATPRKADHVVSMLSTIIAWGVPREFTEANPCREIGKLSGGDGYAPWEWDDIVYAAKLLKPHLWHAAAIALYTGQRQSDVLGMTWDKIVRGEIGVRQDKTGKVLWIPLHRELRPVLDDIPKSSVRILTNSRGRPWASGFKAAWQDEMNQPAFQAFRERRLVFHGLRKSSVVMLLESGCTDAEVAAITGQSRQMVEHYSIMVNQRKLARAAILKWEAANGS